LILEQYSKAVQVFFSPEMKEMKNFEKLPLIKFFQLVNEFAKAKKHKEFVKICLSVPDYQRVYATSQQKGTLSKKQKEFTEKYLTLLLEAVKEM
jgi:hypothetical protein